MGVIGAAIGASEWTIKHNSSYYEEKIAALKDYASQLKGHLDNLNTYNSEVPQFWTDDENAAKYTAMIQIYITKVNNSISRINQMETTLDEIVADAKRSSQLVSGAVDEAKQFLDSLSSK